jgi:hypothetical protein
LSKEIIMGEQKMPNQNQSSTGNPNQPGKQNPQQERESASRPGKQAPDEKQQPNERASTPNREMGQDDAARRQAKQDPLQNRDR